MLTLCLAANVRNFVRFACSSAVQSSIHFGLTPLRITKKGSSETQEYRHGVMDSCLANLLNIADRKVTIKVVYESLVGLQTSLSW